MPWAENSSGGVSEWYNGVMEGVHISRTFEQHPRFACTKKVVNKNPPEFL